MSKAPLLLALTLFCEAAIAQTAAEPNPSGRAFLSVPSIPRTAEGRPDFAGSWATAFITSTGRMDGASSLVVSEQEAKDLSQRFVQWARSEAAGAVIDPDFFAAGVSALAKVKREWRTSLITVPADGVQRYTEEGERLDAQRRKWNEQPADGPEMRPLFERCIVGLGGAPLTNAPSIIVRQFVQTPDHLVIASDGNDTRIIRLNAAPNPSNVTSMLGDSTAHWEGDALVVHTTGLTGQVHRQIITRPQSRVIERFELIGPDELFYRFTVEDTAIYAEPWSAEFVLTRSSLPVLEYACHEHNYSMVNILQAGRMADQRAAGSKSLKTPTGPDRRS